MSKTKIIIIVFTVFLVIGCSLFSPRGSGEIVTYARPFSEFDTMDVSHAFVVEITQGEDFAVVLHVDESFADDLEVVQQGSTLKIGLKPNRNYTTIDGALKADITMPELVALNLSSSSDANVRGFESTEPFYVHLSGNSTLRGDIEAGDTRFEASGNSLVKLSGSAGYVTAKASGDSEIDLARFPAINSTAEASGASTITVNVIGGLDASASGGSRVYYLGDPNLGVVSESGGSEIRSR